MPKRTEGKRVIFYGVAKVNNPAQNQEPFLVLHSNIDMPDKDGNITGTVVSMHWSEHEAEREAARLNSAIEKAPAIVAALKEHP